MGVNPVLFWIVVLLAVYPLTAILLVSLDVPARPVARLARTSFLWTLVIWVLVAVALVAL